MRYNHGITKTRTVIVPIHFQTLTLTVLKSEVNEMKPYYMRISINNTLADHTNMYKDHNSLTFGNVFFLSHSFGLEGEAKSLSNLLYRK